jgi:hypothetical protein
MEEAKHPFICPLVRYISMAGGRQRKERFFLSGALLPLFGTAGGKFRMVNGVFLVQSRSPVKEFM